MAPYLLRSTVVGILALATFSTGPGSVAIAADAANTIRYAIDDEHNINELPREIAEREGFFAREGVKVEIVHFQAGFKSSAVTTSVNAAGPAVTGGSIRDAMAKGTIDMERVQFPLLIQSILGGGKNIGIAVKETNPGYFLMVRPEIKTYADLKGKTISITGPNDGITNWARKLMEMHGVKNTDVTLKAIAGSEGRVDCMRSKECAASSLGQPANYEALDAGFHALGNNNEVPTVMYMFDTATPAWAAAHRDLVVKFIRAQQAAMKFIMDPKNRDVVVKDTVAFMNEPENISRQMVVYVTDPKNRVLPKQSAIDLNGIKAAIALLGDYGVVKQPLPAPERLVDPSFAKAAGP